MVGVPAMAPVPGVRARPGGNEPDVIVQVYGVVPSVASRVVVGYAVSSAAVARLSVTILRTLQTFWRKVSMST